MSRKADELFRTRDPDYIDVAGGIVLDNLTQKGILPQHIDLHLQSLPPGQRAESYARAVRIALQLEDGEMPEWSLPDHPLPDVLHIHPGTQLEQRRKLLEGTDTRYYALGSLVSAIRGKARTDGWAARARSVAFMTWSRILRQVDPLSKEQLDYLSQFHSQAEVDSDRIDLKYARNVVVTSKYICDKVLYDLVTTKLLDLRSYTKGIGKIAVMGVGTMLFKNGEHPDLLPYAEQLDEYADEHDR